jgi:hypothetical protein
MRLQIHKVHPSHVQHSLPEQVVQLAQVVELQGAQVVVVTHFTLHLQHSTQHTARRVADDHLSTSAVKYCNWHCCVCACHELTSAAAQA